MRDAPIWKSHRLVELTSDTLRGRWLGRLWGLCTHIVSQTQTPESFPAVCYTLQDSLHIAVGLGGLPNDMPVALEVSRKKKALQLEKNYSLAIAVVC